MANPERDAFLLAYHTELGKFIREFGQTENSLSWHLAELSGRLSFPQDSNRNTDLLRVLLGANRAAPLADKLKLLVDIAATSDDFDHPLPPEKLVSETDDVLAQLSHIRYLRDKIVHYATHPQKRRTEWYIRTYDIYSVSDRNKAKEVFFKLEHLPQMTGDLRAIAYRIGIVRDPDHARRIDYSHPTIRQHYEAWRYKPHELVGESRSFRDTVRGRKNPPQPSRP